MTKVITIPENLVRMGELVILPRREYDEFLDWKKTFRTFKPTAVQKKVLKEAREDFDKDRHIRLEELK